MKGGGTTLEYPMIRMTGDTSLAVVFGDEISYEINAKIRAPDEALTELEEKMAQYTEKEEGRERACYCHEVLVPAMEKLREPVDEMELLVDNEKWPVPTYSDLMFRV